MEPHIIGFLNICLLPGWQKSYSRIWGALNRELLYEQTDIIYCAVLGDDPNFPLQALPSKMKVIYRGTPSDYEKPLLKKMREIAETDDKLIWYAHTKGITKIGTILENNVWDWLEYMLYFNFEQWRTAVEVLKGEWNAYGVNLKSQPSTHYSGNFWWAKSSYIKTLPTEIGPEYLDSEMWIGRGSKFKGYNAFESQVNHYSTGYKRDKYENAGWICFPFTQTIKNKIAEIKQIPSGWRGHIEFAIWLVNLFQGHNSTDPVIVDLGVNTGTSTVSWAALNMGTITSIDPFDAALPEINESIDILHIDGHFTYEEVKQHFETWEPKVKGDGILIFHNIMSCPDTVGKFYNELHYEKIYMNHSGGIGIISRSHDTLFAIQTLWINRIVDYGSYMTHADFPQLHIDKM